ncbi:MAG: ATP-binding cassette domain-containing protein, partial [Pseudomonadota bacterium]
LQGLRAERAAQIKRQGAAAMELADAPKSGKKVIEAKGIGKTFGERVLFKDFDLKIARGDRVAFVGPNGVGKTTLIKTLTGEIAPDAGEVRLGTGLELAVFDQARAALDPDVTLWEALAGDKQMRVSGRADQVMVRGTPRHVVSYLKDFLFDDAQARAPVRSLSGGEKARLLLAKLMAKEANLLVMDEPTNDLDIETLDLLQELLDDYAGTVLLVSHDRDFIDRVATQTVALERGGRLTVFAGGWSDVKVDWSGTSPAEKPKKSAAKAEKPKDTGAALSFTEQHRLEALPGEIERLEAEIAKLEAALAAPDLFASDPKKWDLYSRALVERQDRLATAEEDWLTLAERAEN